jgi:hypothetical protein
LPEVGVHSIKNHILIRQLWAFGFAICALLNPVISIDQFSKLAEVSRFNTLLDPVTLAFVNVDHSVF